MAANLAGGGRAAHGRRSERSPLAHSPSRRPGEGRDPSCRQRDGRRTVVAKRYGRRPPTITGSWANTVPAARWTPASRRGDGMDVVSLRRLTPFAAAWQGRRPKTKEQGDGGAAVAAGRGAG